MIDNSTLFSIYTLIGVFIISTISFSLLKPKFILHIKIDGSRKIQWDKLFTYSSIISLIFSSLVLLSYNKLITLFDKYRNNRFSHNKNPFTK